MYSVLFLLSDYLRLLAILPFESFQRFPVCVVPFVMCQRTMYAYFEKYSSLENKSLLLSKTKKTRTVWYTFSFHRGINRNCRVKAIKERLRVVEELSCFEITAISPSPTQCMKKGGNFKIRKFFNYPESFLCCLNSRKSFTFSLFLFWDKMV